MKLHYVSEIIVLVVLCAMGCSSNISPIFPQYTGQDSVSSLDYHPKIVVAASDFLGNGAMVYGSFNLKLVQAHDPFNGKPFGDPFYSSQGYSYEVQLFDGLREIAIGKIQEFWSGKSSGTVSFQFSLDSLSVGTKYTLRAFLRVPSDTLLHGDTVVFTQPGDLNGFTRLNDYPEYQFIGKVAFVIKGDVYLKSMDNNLSGSTMYQYFPKTDTWEEFPDNDGNSPSSQNLYTATATKGYAYTTNANLEGFDPTSGSWTPLWDDSLMDRTGIFFFSDGKYVYGGGGKNAFGGIGYPMDNWKYNPSSGKWKKLSPFPGKAHVWANSVYLKGKAYLMGNADSQGGQDEFWEYDPISDSWKQKSVPPFTTSSYDNCTVGSDKFYVQNLGSIWSYDPASDTWQKVVTASNLSNSGGVFVWVDGVIYVGLGLSYPHARFNYLWKYIP